MKAIDISKEVEKLAEQGSVVIEKELEWLLGKGATFDDLRVVRVQGYYNLELWYKDKLVATITPKQEVLDELKLIKESK